MSSKVNVITAPRNVRVTRAWKVSRYPIFPVTITRPDGSVETVWQEQPKAPKVRKAKAKVAKVRVVGTSRANDSERIAREWEILSAISNEVKERYL